MSKDDEDKISNEEKDFYENHKNQEQNFTGKREHIRRRRRIVYTLHQKSYSISEIASELDVSESTVEKDLFRMRQYSFVLLHQLLDSGRVHATVDFVSQIDLIIQELWQKYRDGRVEERLKILSKIAELSFKKQKICGIDPSNLNKETFEQMEFEITDYEVDLAKESKLELKL